MIIEQQFVFGSFFGNTVNHFHSGLVITVEKIYLESFDAHISIFFTSSFQLLVQYVKYRPQHDTYTFVFPVCYQFGQVNSRNGSKHISALGIVPALVHYDVFQSVTGSKVDIIFIGVHVDACTEAYSF